MIYSRFVKGPCFGLNVLLCAILSSCWDCVVHTLWYCVSMCWYITLCDLVLVLTLCWVTLCSTHTVLGCVSMFLWSCASVDTALRDCVIGTSCLSAPPNKTPPIQFTFHFIASPLCNQMASANAFTPIAETEKRMLLGQRCLSTHPLYHCQAAK